MPQALPKKPTPPKKRVTRWVWISFFIEVVIDLFKIVLLFLNAIVGVGTAVDVIGSFILSFFEILLMVSNFFASGLFRNGSGQLANILLMGSAVIIDIPPFLDDFPGTSIATFIMILNARAADRADHKKYEAELKKYTDQLTANKAAQLRAANQAVQNAATVPEENRFLA